MSQFMVDRIEVEKRLGGMLSGTIAAVDDRNRSDVGRALRGALLEVTDHDSIRIPRHDTNRILDGFSLDR